MKEALFGNRKNQSENLKIGSSLKSYLHDFADKKLYSRGTALAFWAVSFHERHSNSVYLS